MRVYRRWTRECRCPSGTFRRRIDRRRPREPRLPETTTAAEARFLDVRQRFLRLLEGSFLEHGHCDEPAQVSKVVDELVRLVQEENARDTC